MIQKQINSVDDPYYILLFKLFELHYFIDMQDFTLADERIKELGQYEEFLEAELEFYYLKFRGLYLYHKSDKLGALESYKKAVILKNSFSLQDWEIAYLYYLLAFVAYEIREDVICIYYYNQASIMFEQQNNSSMIARVKNLYGMILQRLKLFDEALDVYSYALDHCYNVGNMKLLIKIHINLGKLYSNQSLSEKAIEHFKKSIDLLDETNWLIAKIEPIYLLVNEYFNINASLKCIYWLEIANKIISEQNYNTEHTIDLKILEFLLANKTNSVEFKIYLRDTAIPYFKKYNQWENIARYYNILGDYYQRQNKYKNAAHYYKMSNESLQKLILNYKSLRVYLEKPPEFKVLSGSLR
ncbi:tetratricopeptide repeat protein [Sutcliffiella cohnii]